MVSSDHSKLFRRSLNPSTSPVRHHVDVHTSIHVFITIAPVSHVMDTGLTSLRRYQHRVPQPRDQVGLQPRQVQGRRPHLWRRHLWRRVRKLARRQPQDHAPPEGYGNHHQDRGEGVVHRRRECGSTFAGPVHRTVEWNHITPADARRISSSRLNSRARRPSTR